MPRVHKKRSGPVSLRPVEDAVFYRMEIREKLQLWMNDLSTPELFAMYFRSEYYPQSKIAEILGRKPSQVRQNIRMARKKAKEIIPDLIEDREISTGGKKR